MEIVSLLLEAGANINDRGGAQCGGVTPLHDACNCGNLDVIRLLVGKGANVHAKDDEVLLGKLFSGHNANLSYQWLSTRLR